MDTPKTTDVPTHIESSDQLGELVVDSAVVLVDYHTGWCDPCEILGPAVKEIAEETSTVVAKVDIDELQELAHEQGIRSVPTLQFYAGGKQVEGVIGVQNKEDLVDITEATA